MKAPMCCLFFKGDWAEYAHTVGVATWSDSLRPCFACVGFGQDLFNPNGNSPSGLRWQCAADGDYDGSCSRCEKLVRITSIADRALILRNLEYDTRPSRGNNGRCLKTDLPALALRQGDRLEPSHVLDDIGAFERFPIGEVATFWRRSEEGGARHRNPCFMADMGLSGDRCLTFDVLHCLHLGVMNTYCAVSLWEILDSGVFGLATSQDHLQHAVAVMRNRMIQFYADHRRLHPGSPLTEVSDLTLGRLTTREAGVLKTKGAETYGMLKFVLHVLDVYGQSVPQHDRLSQAGTGLLRLVEIWRTSKWRLAPAEIEEHRCKL